MHPLLTVLTFNLKYCSNLPFKVSNVRGTLSVIDCILQDLFQSKMSMSQQKDQNKIILLLLSGFLTKPGKPYTMVHYLSNNI